MNPNAPTRLPRPTSDLVKSRETKIIPSGENSDHREGALSSSPPSGKKKKQKSKEDKPKRPLSAYNLFFQHERDLLLRSTASPFGYSHDANHCTLGRDPSKRADRSKKVRPPPHGKIGFAELARTIGARWKSADGPTKDYFGKLAERERERYQREMEIWRSEQRSAGGSDCARSGSEANIENYDSGSESVGSMPQSSLPSPSFLPSTPMTVRPVAPTNFPLAARQSAPPPQSSVFGSRSEEAYRRASDPSFSPAMVGQSSDGFYPGHSPMDQSPLSADAQQQLRLPSPDPSRDPSSQYYQHGQLQYQDPQLGQLPQRRHQSWSRSWEAIPPPPMYHSHVDQRRGFESQPDTKVASVRGPSHSHTYDKPYDRRSSSSREGITTTAAVPSMAPCFSSGRGVGGAGEEMKRPAEQQMSEGKRYAINTAERLQQQRLSGDREALLAQAPAPGSTVARAAPQQQAPPAQDSGDLLDFLKDFVAD